MNKSRVEDILESTINAQAYTEVPKSRVEELLLELKEKIESGGGGGDVPSKEATIWNIVFTEDDTLEIHDRKDDHEITPAELIRGINNSNVCLFDWDLGIFTPCTSSVKDADDWHTQYIKHFEYSDSMYDGAEYAVMSVKVSIYAENESDPYFIYYDVSVTHPLTGSDYYFGYITGIGFYEFGKEASGGAELPVFELHYNDETGFMPNLSAPGILLAYSANLSEEDLDAYKKAKGSCVLKVKMPTGHGSGINAYMYLYPDTQSPSPSYESEYTLFYGESHNVYDVIGFDLKYKAIWDGSNKIVRFVKFENEFNTVQVYYKNYEGDPIGLYADLYADNPMTYDNLYELTHNAKKMGYRINVRYEDDNYNLHSCELNTDTDKAVGHTVLDDGTLVITCIAWSSDPTHKMYRISGGA